MMKGFKMYKNPEERAETQEWWNTTEGIASIRQDHFRHLAWGLGETDLDLAYRDAERGSCLSALLIGIGGLREELLAWAESQMQPSLTEKQTA